MLDQIAREPKRAGSYSIGMATSKPSGSRGNVRVINTKPQGKTPLVSSNAKAEQEKAGLRRGRERLDSQKSEGDTSIRSSLI